MCCCSAGWCCDCRVVGLFSGFIRGSFSTRFACPVRVCPFLPRTTKSSGFPCFLFTRRFIIWLFYSFSIWCSPVGGFSSSRSPLSCRGLTFCWHSTSFRTKRWCPCWTCSSLSFVCGTSHWYVPSNRRNPIDTTGSSYYRSACIMESMVRGLCTFS